MPVVAEKRMVHPHVYKQKDVCGGRSVVTGTRIPVWSLIKWYKLGLTVEDVMKEFPQLSPSQTVGGECGLSCLIDVHAEQCYT